jgi:hypothetical protein
MANNKKCIDIFNMKKIIILTAIALAIITPCFIVIVSKIMEL